MLLFADVGGGLWQQFRNEFPARCVNVGICEQATVGMAAQAVKAGEADLMIAGGVESMSRAPFVMPKSDSALRAVASFSNASRLNISSCAIIVFPKIQFGMDARGCIRLR